MRVSRHRETCCAPGLSSGRAGGRSQPGTIGRWRNRGRARRGRSHPVRPARSRCERLAGRAAPRVAAPACPQTACGHAARPGLSRSLRTLAADARTLAGTMRAGRVRAPGWTCFTRLPGTFPRPCRSQCSLAALLVAYADGFVDARQKNLAVADLAGARGIGDRCNRLVHQAVRHDGLNLHLGEKIDRVLAAAIELGMSLLSSVTADLGYGHALHSDFEESVFDGFELRRLNHCFQLGHKVTLTVRTNLHYS